MAADSLTREERDAMKTVLGSALDKLKDARNKLNIARGAPAEDCDDD
jgi:hypothetical protein